MNWLRPAAGAALSIGLLLAMPSCGSSEPESGKGGATSSGGVSSDGGATPSGGKPSQGGATSNGGTSSGGKSSSGGATSGGAPATGGKPSSGGSAGGSACKTVGDCRLFDDYCDGCTCRALGKNDPDPSCSGSMVSCIIQPCSTKSAACLDGRCIAVTGL